jgi:hypothetical protein
MRRPTPIPSLRAREALHQFNPYASTSAIPAVLRGHGESRHSNPGHCPLNQSNLTPISNDLNALPRKGIDIDFTICAKHGMQRDSMNNVRPRTERARGVAIACVSATQLRVKIRHFHATRHPS